MKKIHVLYWALAGLVGALLLAWFFPLAYPTLPDDWQVDRDEAIALAGERVRVLGEPVDDYVDIRLTGHPVLERRYWLSSQTTRERFLDGWLAESLTSWEIRFFDQGAGSGEWTYRARVSPRGEVTRLQLRVEADEEGGVIEQETARQQADAFLVEQGFDLSRFRAPEIRSTQLEKRTDLSLRYLDSEELFGDQVPYGVEVDFAGDRLAGYEVFLDDPEEEAFEKGLGGFMLAQQSWLFAVLLLVPVVAVFFVRRYHEGEIGVRRSLRLMVVVLSAATLFIVLAVKVIGVGWNMGPISRSLTTVIAGFQIMAFFFLPVALMAFLAWGVGEALTRQRYPHRLAAFDALLKRDFNNSTLPQASLRGLSAGLMLAALLVVSALLIQRAGAWVPTIFFFGPWWEGTKWFGVSLLLFVLVYRFYTELFGRLLLVSVLTSKFGQVAGALIAAAIGSVLFFPGILPFPVSWGLPVWFLVALAQTVLFLRYGLLTALQSAMTTSVVVQIIPFLRAGDPWIQFQAMIPLVALAIPLLLSARNLLRDKKFFYRWDDVPPHVRRIAERERQRVELETARQIQSSILPELPPQLNGVELAHTYKPATEVGGDFYDVLALEDGRLAVAIGDVAGHGVSSGLVMSMAKAALAVQVTVNPDVATVFNTLNRVIYQSARKRLLATLCYGVLDPIRREMRYASAGHLYPYVITAERKVHPLEYVAYPLGVRIEMEVDARLARLDKGDTLFLLSDGLVEARAEGEEDLFGFDRLEESLRRHAHLGVKSLRDAVLADVDAFTRSAPQEDDLTVLVLRVP